MSAAESKAKHLAEKQARREAMLLEKKLTNIKIVEMNKEIARCADRKDLNKAMSLFDDAKDKNTHTYAAIMNVCVRCGDLGGVIRLFKELKTCEFYKQLDLVCCTTLMKGYCAEGDVTHALRILDDMVKQRPHPVSPNIRTINTILRGAVLIGDNKSAYSLLAQCPTFKPPVKPDESTMEHVVTLATQALDLDRVFPLIGRLAAQSKETAFAMSGMYICVTRACAMLHQWKQAGKYLQLARAALVAEAAAGGSVGGERLHDDEDADVDAVRDVVKGATGGKKAWGNASGGDGSRAKSLQVYVSHKREEQQRELDGIDAFMTAAKVAAAAPAKVDNIADLIDSYKRFILFPHAPLPGYDDREEEKQGATTAAAAEMVVDVASYDRLGLSMLCSKTGNNGAAASVSAPASGSKKSKGKTGGKRKASEMESGETDAPEEAEQLEKDIASASTGLLQQFAKYLARAVNNSAKRLDFGAIFGASNGDSNSDSNIKGTTKRGLKLEICTGAGEWIVTQAAADRASDWVALELRFDRAYQTFVRGYFQQLKNLCVLRGDANNVLDAIEPASLEQIYINHPEPPQQRGAHLESTGKHLLTKDFFIQCEKLLLRSPGSYITVLTDNLWYGKFLINMLASNASTVPLTSYYTAASSGSVQEVANDFVLYSQAPEGLGSAAVVDASSYFDRLWKKESITERYYIVLKPWDLSAGKTRPQYGTPVSASASAGSKSKDFKGSKSFVKEGEKKHKAVVAAPVYQSGNEMSQSNSKYSVKCSGIIVAPQGKKQTFDVEE